MRLDRDRQVVLRQLSLWLSAVLEGTEALTAAALSADRDAFTRSKEELLELAQRPVLDLAMITEIYNGLRLAIVERQPASWGAVPLPVGPALPAPGTTGTADIRWPSASRQATEGRQTGS